MPHRTYETARFSPITQEDVSITSQKVGEDYGSLECGWFPSERARLESNVRWRRTWPWGGDPTFLSRGQTASGKAAALEKLADPAPCQDQIDKVVENQNN